MDTGEDRSPGVARRTLGAMSEDARKKLVTQASEVFSVGEDRITDAHVLGIKNVEAEKTEYGQRVNAGGRRGRCAPSG